MEKNKPEITAIDILTMHSGLLPETIKTSYSWVLSAMNEYGSRKVLEYQQEHPSESTLPAKDKIFDSMVAENIEIMWGGLEMASIQHFIETGKINGSFRSRLKEFAYRFAKNWHNQSFKPR